MLKFLSPIIYKVIPKLFQDLSRFRNKFGMTILLVIFAHNSYAFKKPKLVFSITPIASLAAMLTEGSAEIEILLNEPVCPHHYTPRPSDLKKIEKADLQVFINEDFDGYAFKLAESRNDNIVKIGDFKKLRILGGTGRKNWHLWLDLDNAEVILEELAKIFSTSFPETRSKVTHNLIEAKAKISRLRAIKKEKIGDLSDAILISDSAEYFFAGTSIKMMFAPHHVTLKYITELERVVKSGKGTVFISRDQNTGFLDRLPVNVITIDTENWALPKGEPLNELYIKKYLEIIESLEKKF